MAKRRTTSDRLSPPLNASKEHLIHHSGINPVNQSSDDTAGVFEDIMKVDDSFAPYFLTHGAPHAHIQRAELR